MEHITRFIAGHDCIRFKCRFGSKECKPGAGGSHGVSGLKILFVANGTEGAVQFVLSTGLLPQYKKPSSIGTRDMYGVESNMLPMDIWYHSKSPRYDGHEPISDTCEFCDGEPCYYDGSGLNANDAMYALVNGGDAALWEFLDAYYEAVFNDGKYPEPAEYIMPLRTAQL